MSCSSDPMDCSPPGTSVHGVFQARILEWVAISFSRGSSYTLMIFTNVDVSYLEWVERLCLKHGLGVSCPQSGLAGTLGRTWKRPVLSCDSNIGSYLEELQFLSSGIDNVSKPLLKTPTLNFIGCQCCIIQVPPNSTFCIFSPQWIRPNDHFLHKTSL